MSWHYLDLVLINTLSMAALIPPRFFSIVTYMEPTVTTTGKDYYNV